MEMESYLRFILALVFVLALIGVLAWVARRYGVGGRPGPRNRRDRRLEVIETRVIDGKRRLVLLRRDHVEHLVLMGPTSEIVIEQGIAGQAEIPAARGPTPNKKEANFKDEVTKSLNKAKSRRSAKA
jgi:flagellar protein FliO/FliZ